MNPTSRNTRTWTDAQLRSAIACSVTWRQVAQALGLSNGTATRIKRYAKTLGLDTSHFVETRRWSERDLRDAVKRASSWSDVMERLSIDDSSNARVRIKGHAVRLRIDVSHLGSIRPAETVGDILSSRPDVARLRVAAEFIATAWFTLRGVPVAVPSEHCAYDLLVTLPAGVKRIQVKTGTVRKRHGTWHVGIGRRPYVLDKTADKVPYDPDEIDYYLIIDGDGALYFIPSQVVGGMTAIHVGAYEEYRVGDASSLITTAS